MSIINYNDIDFSQSINKETNVINFNGIEIQVLKYLSIQDKYDLIMNTIVKADEIDLYNSFKTKFYFDLNLVLMYSNIVLSQEDKEDELKLYDNLKQSGLMDLIVEKISQEDKDELWGHIMKIQSELINYRRSTSGLVTMILEKGPGVIEKAKEVLSMLDKDKVQELLKILVKKDVLS